MKVAQRVGGIYRLVTLPAFYERLQGLLGAKRGRERFMSEVLKPKAGMNVLDIGCGPAGLLQYLPPVKYTGIDLNPPHIAKARETYGNRGTFFVGNVTEDLELDRGSFDLIIVSALLHHISDVDASRLLGRLVNFLVPFGRIVTLDNVWLPNQNPIARALIGLDSGLHVRTAQGYRDLVAHLPVTLQEVTYRNLLRVPYDHFSMTLVKAAA